MFRAGDYNSSSHTPNDHFVSIHMKDYAGGPSSLRPAGISTTTRKGYSHVIPDKTTHTPSAINSLRNLLINKNKEEFQSPRDPTSINVTQAFLKYDQNR